MTHFVWKDVPPEVRGAIEPLLEGVVGLIPAWCRQVVIGYATHPDNDGAALELETRPEQRLALLDICPSWLAEPHDTRARMIRHEVAHILLAPVEHHFRGLVEDLSEEDSPLRRRIDREWLVALEAVVEDLAWAFTR